MGVVHFLTSKKYSQKMNCLFFPNSQQIIIIHVTLFSIKLETAWIVRNMVNISPK